MKAKDTISTRQRRVWQIVFALAFVLCQDAGAGGPSPPPVTDILRDTFTALNGLPQSTVDALARTRDGYLWVGTQDGLARFDGNRFEVFNVLNSDGLSQSHVRALAAARDGTLWIGTQSRGVVHVVNGKFIPYSVADGLVDPFIRCIVEDRQGAVWFGTLGGLARWRGGRFDGFTTRDGLADNNVQAIAEDSRGRIWLGTAAGLSLLENGKFISFPDRQRFAGQSVTSLAVDHEDRVWVGGNKRLALLVDGRAVPWGSQGESMPASVDQLAVDQTGALWIGTDSDGLFRLRAGVLERYGTAEGLSDAVVLALLADADGNLWVGTDAGGLNRLQSRRIVMIGAPEGLSDNNAVAMMEDRDGSLWIATASHGLNHFHNGKVDHFTSRDGLGSDMVYSLWQSPRNGTVWAGAKDGSVNWLDGRRFRQLTLPDHGSVVMIMEDHAGNMWLGTRHGLVQVRDGRAVRTYTKDDGLANSSVLTILEAHDGSLWVGTIDGLSHLENGKFTNYSSSRAGGTLVTSIYEDSSGVVWFTTTGDGLGRWQDGKLSWTTTRNGLADDVLYAVVDDGLGNMWLSSDRGIFRIARQELNDLAAGKIASLTARVFDTGDGLRSNECYGGTQPTGWKRRNGDLLFACIGGVVAFNPTELAQSPKPPPVSIEEVRINGKDIRPEAPGETPRIAPGMGNLEFAYTGIDFAAPRQMRFWYRLENFDKEWVEAGTRRTAYYTNIPPGNYRFEVVAQNADGVKSPIGASVAFVLEPRFYQTGLFYCVAALLLFALVWGVYRLRIRQIESQQKQLQELVEVRTAALQIEVAERKRTEIELDAARHAAEEARADAEHRATHDFLSGIYNRAAIIDLLNREAARCQRDGQPMSVLLADIDHFKTINDTYGHLVGDEVIKLVVLRMAIALRSYDSVGRFGGEEFLIVVPNCTASEAVVVAERLRVSVATEKFVIGKLVIPVSVSVGVSTKTDAAQDVDWALQVADSALYDAKAKGRNRVESYRPLDLPGRPSFRIGS
jgi:diguanylate cyclase (GGDEF)-like protein